MKRVVITGCAGISPIGSDADTIFRNMQAGQSGIKFMSEWENVEGLKTRLGGPVTDFDVPTHYERKKIRSMGRGSLMATRATELALMQAGLLNSDILKSGNCGIAYGSSSSGIELVTQIGLLSLERKVKGITATSWLQIMSHICAANIELFFGICGRLIPTSSACTSGSLAIGYAYEAIKNGYQTVMVAGGAEELNMTIAAMFDIMFVTSIKNAAPASTPSPFDKDRDGLVVAEGASTLILEELEHAQARGAHIIAEVVGFGTNCDGKHITNPSVESMQKCMMLAIRDAGIPTDAIGYVKAHATGTEVGDIAESQATAAIFGPNISVSSLKSYFGHSLGASGALEAWLTLEMLQRDWYAPTLNLQNVDERCASLNYIQGAGRHMKNEHVMSNSFAFGGVNTSLIFKRWQR